LNPSQKLATCCRVKSCAKNRPRYHVTRRSIFRATMLREKSSLQVVPCNTAFIQFLYIFTSFALLDFFTFLSLKGNVSLYPFLTVICRRSSSWEKVEKVLTYMFLSLLQEMLRNHRWDFLLMKSVWSASKVYVFFDESLSLPHVSLIPFCFKFH